MERFEIRCWCSKRKTIGKDLEQLITSFLHSFQTTILFNNDKKSKKNETANLYTYLCTLVWIH